MIILTPYHGTNGDSKFNIRKQYLKETIDSIDKQNIDYLHIIIDDGSTDEICTELAEKNKDNPHRIILRGEKSKNDLLTCTNALNYGLDLVLNKENIQGRDLKKHDIVTILHSDDLAINLKHRKEFIKENDFDFLYTDALLFFNNHQEGFVWQAINGDLKDIINNLWIYEGIPYPTMTWKKDFLKELKNYNFKKFKEKTILDPNIGCGEDLDLVLKSLGLIDNSNFKKGYSPKITVGYRIHDASLTNVRNLRQRKKEETSVLKKHFGNLGTLKLKAKKICVQPGCYFPKLRKFQFEKKEKKDLLEVLE